jgi:sulfur carrier protein
VSEQVDESSPDVAAIAIVVNGTARDVPVGMSVPDLLVELGLGVGWVIVEHNGTALLRKEVEMTVLAAGDILELVRAMAGG